MKNKKIFVFIIIIATFSFTKSILANELCLKNGYTILTINGIFTNEKGAIENRDRLKDRFLKPYNNQPIAVDYVYNPTHVIGVGDLVDVARQGLFDPKSDYDLVEMLNDASEKVKTQKVLIVGHSQGNFYANNLYDKVADVEGGVPSQSIGVYGVASPDKRVAGNGKYMTSDTDKVIATVVSRLKNILEPNTHIELTKGDGNGHSFADVYLKYRGSEIVKDIKWSLDKLEENNIQNTNSRCIAPEKVSLMHKITGAYLTSLDFSAEQSLAVYKTYSYPFRTLAGVFGNLFSRSLALVGGADDEVAPSPNLNIQENTNPTLNETVLTETVPTEEKGIDVVQEETTVPAVLDEKENIPDEESNHSGGGHSSSGGGVSNSTETDTDTNPDTSGDTGSNTDGNTNTGTENQNPTPDTTKPIITLNGNDVIYLKLNDTYTDSGATANDDKDGNVPVVISGVVDTSKIGEYILTYTAIDAAGNIATKNRTVKVSSYIYIPKFSFGKNNGDGNNWQDWYFTGSNIYDWSDVYIDGFLYEHFKLKTTNGSAWCTSCLQGGLFNHDPRQGFETIDLKLISIEKLPQNRMNNTLYDVGILWDETGYTYTISHDGIIDDTGHKDVLGINKNMWVGWDAGLNNFQTFPSGRWIGEIPQAPMERTGGMDMVLTPQPIHIGEASSGSSLILPNYGERIGTGINQTVGKDKITGFNFEVIYKNTNNTGPSDVVLHTISGSGETFSHQMNKNNLQGNIYTDGDFVNGESYVSTDILFETGEYDYYFTVNDGSSELRMPEEGYLSFSVKPSTYKYVPKYTFGSDNGDGNNWQVWYFTGSYFYDWSDTYVNGYLHEKFKIQNSDSAWCNSCIQRGVFNHDPQIGFESLDVVLSDIENNPQNNRDKKVYEVSFQWDELGYTYTISKDGTVYASGHKNINNAKDAWVGWDTTSNNFKTFPSGKWMGVMSAVPGSPSGGMDMIIKPYKVFDTSAPQEPGGESDPDPVVLSQEKLIKSFDFKNINPNVAGVIDNSLNTVNVSVPFGTDVTKLTPTISISDKASIIPGSLVEKDFASPVTYTITAEDKTTNAYVVTVTVLPKPTPDPDPTPITVLPKIESYKFGNTQGDASFDPTIGSLNIFLVANKDVDWVTVIIERIDDHTFSREFRPDDSSCKDGSSTCEITWNGKLSPAGRAAVDGVYQVRVHIKDSLGKEWWEALPSKITVTGQTS